MGCWNKTSVIVVRHTGISFVAWLCLVGLASASTREAVAPSATGTSRILIAQADAPRSFDIPAQPLEDALAAFGLQSGLQVSVDSTLASGLTSQPVQGTHAPDVALRQMLQGTGLTYRMAGDRTVILEKSTPVIAPPVPVQEQSVTPLPESGDETKAVQKFKPIRVPEVVIRERKERGYKTDEEVSSPTRLPAPVGDLPQSVEVITRKLMDDQKAIRIQDVIRNVSGVFVSNTQGSRQDAVNIRGFVSTQNIFKNGFRDDGAFANRVFRETANLQRIEFLKGPASFLYGRANSGGIMNLITKKPLADPYYSTDMIFGSYNLYRPTIDLSGPLTQDKSILYRFNGLYESSGSFREGVKSDRIFAAPTVSWAVGPRTTILLEGEYINDDRVIDRGIIALGRGVAPVPISTFLGDATRRTEFNQGKATLVLLHELNGMWTWREGFRASANSEGYDSIEQNGNPTANGTIPLVLLNQPAVTQSYYLQNELIGVFSLLFEQRLLMGVELGRERFNQTITQRAMGTTNVFNPTRTFIPTGSSTLLFDGTIKANFVAPYLVDQIAIRDDLKLTFGGRFDIFDQEQTDRGVHTSLSQNFFSPMAGIVYQPVKPVSLYANYSRSFNPQFGLITVSGDMIRPATGTQYEVGIKTEFLDGRLSTNLAAFQIWERNLATADPVNPSRFSVPTGERRSQGIELDISGRPMPGVDVIATYAYIDAELTRDNTFAVGNTFPNVPLHSGSLWTTYTVQSGPLQNVGAGVYAAEKRLGDFANTYEMPGFVRVDAALYYRKPEIFKRTNLLASLNFRNLLDQTYYEGSRENRREIYPGAPFTVIGSIKLEFF